MTVITAKGETRFGELNVIVFGTRTVERIECDSKVKWYIESSIYHADGEMANGYHPESNTMLQAFAFLTGLFGYDAVKVDGYLEEIPQPKEGVIY